MSGLKGEAMLKASITYVGDRRHDMPLIESLDVATVRLTVERILGEYAGGTIYWP